MLRVRVLGSCWWPSQWLFAIRNRNKFTLKEREEREMWERQDADNRPFIPRSYISSFKKTSMNADRS